MAFLPIAGAKALVLKILAARAPGGAAPGGAASDREAGGRSWLWLGACVLAGVTLWRVLTTATIRLAYPQDLPLGDVGEYTVWALRFRDQLLAGDFEGLYWLILQPELHPPMHKILLGIWLGLVGDGFDSARSFGAAGVVGAVLVVVHLAREIAPEGGRYAGLFAGVMAAAGGLWMTLSVSPMSEPTTFIAVGLGLSAGIRALGQRAIWPHLRFGLVVGSMLVVKYNLPFMLLLPLLAVHLWEHRRAPRQALDKRLLLWVLPLVVVALLWQLARPMFLEVVREYLINTESGMSRWSKEALSWLPKSMTDVVINDTRLATVMAISAVLGLVPFALGRDLRLDVGGLRFGLHIRLGTSLGLRVLQVFVLATLTALMLHPYKLVRNLHMVAPLMYLVAVLPWIRSRVRMPLPGGGWWTLLLTVLLLGPYVHGRLDFPNAGRLQTYTQNPSLRYALERIEEAGRGKRYLLVAGWLGDAEWHHFELWMRDRNVFDSTVIYWSPTVVPHGARWLTPPAQAVDPVSLMTPELVSETLYVVVDAPRTHRSLPPGTAMTNQHAQAVTTELAALGVVEMASYSLDGDGVRIRIFQQAGVR